MKVVNKICPPIGMADWRMIGGFNRITSANLIKIPIVIGDWRKYPPILPANGGKYKSLYHYTGFFAGDSLKRINK